VHSKKNIYQSQWPNIGDYDIVYGSTQICTYCDVNWASNMDDRRSMLGYAFLLGNDAINWNSKNQTFIAMSSIKVECMEISQTTRQAMWFHHFLEALVFHR
jgi:hypothetical protein